MWRKQLFETPVRKVGQMGDTSIIRNKERPRKTIGQREILASRYLAHPFQHSILLVEIQHERIQAHQIYMGST